MNFRIDTLTKRIGLGYALMVLVLAISVTITLLRVRDVSRLSDFLIEKRQPSSQADLQIMNGFNHSIASLRGWILFKKDTFKRERRYAWKEEIRSPLSALESLSAAWTNVENVKRLSRLRPLIDRIEIYQQDVEDMASVNSDSAIALMDEKVLPLNKEIRQILDELSSNHMQLMLADFDQIQNQVAALSNLEWILLGIGLVASILLALAITRSIVNPVSSAVVVAQNIGSGDLQTIVDVGGSRELDMLGHALTNMRDALQTRTAENQRYNWLNDGQNKLNEVMRGDKSPEELANNIVQFLASYTGSVAGTLFLANDAGSELLLTGSVAVEKSNLRTSFKRGEGLIGQSAEHKKSIAVQGTREINLNIRSSLLNSVPENVYIIPFLFEGKALGVIELGKQSDFTDVQKEFLGSAMESIGIAMNSAVAQRKIRELLEETQRQSEELQQQQEELQQSNEELEEHTQKLKEQQEELQASNEELEEQTQVVEQKNKDLETARTQIELKAKQLEISSKYKSEFLANMSHELRTPLNSLLILSGDLAQNKTNNLHPDQVESAEVISKSGHDLLNLINEILDLSKIEAGKMDLNVVAVSISDIADNISRNFRKQTEQKGLRLEISMDDSLPQFIHTDRQRLDQVLKNLISNAIKFTHKGFVKIAFAQHAGGFLSVAVSDSGIGIPRDKQDIVFEAFQQADGGTSRKYGGTGLGLSISRELARLLGGRITLESEPGKGATFALIIPFHVAGSASPEPPRDKPITKFIETDSSYINYPTAEDERNDITESDNVILIIEDDVDFLRILAAQAKSKGFKFLAASSGEDGLLLAERFVPDAILLDIDLPGMDGNMVLKDLKGNPTLRHIPVHIVSVNEKTLDPIKSGAIEYMTKPVSRKQLEEAFTRIENFINRKMKNLLIIEDDTNLRRSIVKLIGNGDVQCLEAATGSDALSTLRNATIDCMVVDIGLPDMSGFELIRIIEKEFGDRVPPIIVYTGRELSREENEELQQHAETIIVKGVKSEERLLDETALFLHRTVKNLPPNKQKIIAGMYDTESIFQDKKILLVDDDMRNIFALSKVLKDKGLDVLKAENGKIAIEILKKEKKIDLVLMDIMMPEMDGYECMREIRKMPAFKTLPVIALTAKAMKEDRQKCIDAGADDYITKPVDVERLFSLMRIWINKQ